MDQARVLRVVVASPGDVAAEREAVVRAAEEVNRNVAEERGLMLRVYRWETHARPGFNPEGPQGIIDPILRIEACDLLIAIFWKRFGTPTLDGRTGTEHEFNIAYQACKEKRQPEIMMYFRRQPEGWEDEQSRLVNEFQKKLPKEGLWWSYDGDGEFEDLVRNHLTRFVLGIEPVSALNALHSLPPPPADFTGREAELAELRAAMEQGGAHISGLRGQGGVGKTALALKLAEELSPRFPDAQIYLDLKGVSTKQAGERPLTTAEALAYVIRACHPDAKLPENEAELRGIYLNLLHGKRALLLMDNARDRAQLEPLIPPTGCALLVTSRTHFTLPGLKPKNLETLPPNDAERLLLEIEKRINGEAANIARLCGYLPLALRLAGSTLGERPELAPSDYARRLEKERLKVLTESEASIGLSYALLDAEMQNRWRTLGVFRDTFDAHAAAAVWNGVILNEADSGVILRETKDPGISDQTNTEILRPSPQRPPQNDTEDQALIEAQDMLGRLLQYSMLEWNETARRYRLHDLMRDFALARLQEASEENEAARRHAAYYVNVLAQANRLYFRGGDSIKGALALFDLEWGNVQAGQVWAATHAEAGDDVAGLCSRYPYDGWYCLSLRQSARQRIGWLEVALAAAGRLKDSRAEGWHAAGLGVAYDSLGEYRRAIEHHKKHLAIAREIGDRQGEGAALGNLGTAYYSLGEYRRAIEYHEQALGVDREIGNRRGEGQDLGSLGNAHYGLGEYRPATEYHEQHLAIARETGDRQGESQALGNLGVAYHRLGEYRRAIEYIESALAIDREIGDRRGEGEDLGNLGNAYYTLAEYRRAIEYHEQHLAIAREIGDRRGEGTALGNLGVIYCSRSEYHRAIECYEHYLVIAREIGDRQGEGNALGNLGLAYYSLGEYRRAIEYQEQQLAITREIGDQLGEANSLFNMSLALDKLGERPKAIENAEAALKIFEQIESPTAAEVGKQLEEWRKSGDRAIEPSGD